VTTVLTPGTFFGDVAAVHDAERVRLSESVHQPGEHLPPHAHVSPYLSFVLRGAYDESVRGRRIACDTFALRFHPAGEEHADTFGSAGAVCLNIELAGDWGESLERLGVQGAAPLTNAGAASVLRLFQSNPEWADVSALALEEATLELLGLCALREREGRAAVASEALRRAVDYLEAHLTGTVTLAAGAHPTHLARLFRERLGCTVGEYVRARRLEVAQKALVGRPEWHLSRVAAEHGFADHAHFTRTFRRACGMTPSTFRQLARWVPERKLLPPT